MIFVRYIRRHLFAAGIIIAFLFLIVITWYSLDFSSVKGLALRQETVDWAEWERNLPPGIDVAHLYSDSIPNEQRPGLLLRYLDNEKTTLLLKHTFENGIYQYDRRENKTSKSSEDSWKEAVGDIVVCENQRWSRAEAFNVDTRNHRLIGWDENKTPYDTYGRWPLDAIVSPSKKLAAILSASGPKKPYFEYGWFGLGGQDPKFYGQRYVQIMDLETKQYVGMPVRLFAESPTPCFSSCWSSDEGILISYNCNFSDFQIVEPFQVVKKAN